jgi:SulP family sulfate permease
VSAAAPAAAWLRNYRREWLPADVVAGLTTAAVVIPQAMAYAVIAGLPVETGLYTALAAMLVYPFLGTSRALSVTTTSAIATLTGAEIVAVSESGNAASAVTVAATLALVVGAVLVAARVLRLGFVANFISKPVLVGFQAGVGVVIITGQLKSVLGVHIASRSTLGTLLELPGHLGETHGATLLVALAGVAVLLAMRRFVPRLSGPLTWVVLAIAAAKLLDLQARGVMLVGAVPVGLPSLAVPDLALVRLVWPAALGIALMSFTESVAAARTFCGRHDAPIRADRELEAIGAAGLASAFACGMPVGGGASQTAVSNQAGVKSQAAQLVGAAAVLVTLLFLSPVIGLLPKPALAALILVAAASMIKPAAFRAIARVRKDEVAWSFVTMAGVIALGTLNGILVAVAVSMLTLMYQANHPPVYIMKWNRALRIFRRAGESPDDETFPGLLILRTEGRLTFANAERAGEQMRLLLNDADVRVIVLDCSAIPDIEYTALEMLTEAEAKQRERGVMLWLASINPDLHKVIRRSRLGAALGQDRVFPNLRLALEAFQRTMGGPSTPPG